MATLGALKKTMAFCVVGVMGFFFALIFVIAMLLLGGAGQIMSWIIIIAFCALIILIQWGIGPWTVKAATKLKYLKEGENLFLENMVTKLCKKAEVPMPKLAVVKNEAPNAFVFGRSVKNATLAVHTGLLKKLNNEEIEGVIAHEIGHLKHKDVVIMTVLSCIPLICYMIFIGMYYGGIFGSMGRSRNNDGGALVMLAIAAIAFAIYFITQLFIMKLSRTREYYADSYSAMLTGNPHGLSSALTKITFGLSLSKDQKKNTARAFCIGDPESAKKEMAVIYAKANEYDLNHDGILDQRELELAMEKEAKGKFGHLNETWSTHPPTFKRILQLKQIEEELSSSTGLENIYKNI